MVEGACLMTYPRRTLETGHVHLHRGWTQLLDRLSVAKRPPELLVGAAAQSLLVSRMECAGLALTNRWAHPRGRDCIVPFLAARIRTVAAQLAGHQSRAFEAMSRSTQLGD